MSDTIQTIVPSDHPMKKAWDQWQGTDEFMNCLIWAQKAKYDDGRPIDSLQIEQHIKGALWLAFTKGYEHGIEDSLGE